MNSELETPILCPQCGNPMIQDGIFDNDEDVTSPEYAVMYDLHCAHCGTVVSVYSPSEGEKENEYKDYWKR